VKNCLQLDGKKFATNEEIIAVIEELEKPALRRDCSMDRAKCVFEEGDLKK
jgi:hypothetical protein